MLTKSLQAQKDGVAPSPRSRPAVVSNGNILSQRRPALVFSTTASSYLADRIAALLGLERGRIERSAFGDGERYYRVAIADRVSFGGGF